MPTPLSWGECRTHGRVLVGFMGRCALCQERKTKPAPKHRRRTIGRGRIASIDLTPAERRVAEMLAAGKSQKQIARELGFHPSSVSNTVRRACSRVGVEETYELIRHVRARQGERGLG